MKENSVVHDGMSLTKAGKLVQKNGGHSLEATQPGVTAVKKPSTDRSPTEGVGDGQHVLSCLVDFPCMKKEPQTRTMQRSESEDQTLFEPIQRESRSNRKDGQMGSIALWTFMWKVRIS